MKEHITPKQAKEVTEDDFYYLMDYSGEQCVRRKDWFKYHNSKMTVGRMIGILRKPKNGITMSEHVFSSAWRVGIQFSDGSSISTSNVELCDALWEAVLIHDLIHGREKRDEDVVRK